WYPVTASTLLRTHLLHCVGACGIFSAFCTVMFFLSKTNVLQNGHRRTIDRHHTEQLLCLFLAIGTLCRYVFILPHEFRTVDPTAPPRVLLGFVNSCGIFNALSVLMLFYLRECGSLTARRFAPVFFVLEFVISILRFNKLETLLSVV